MKSPLPLAWAQKLKSKMQQGVLGEPLHTDRYLQEHESPDPHPSISTCVPNRSIYKQIWDLSYLGKDFGLAAGRWMQVSRRSLHGAGLGS